MIFSGVPQNRIHWWKEGAGLSVFMTPSGYTGLPGFSKEAGSNGLALDRQGRIVFCEHGDRRVSVLTPGGGERTLADNYQGRRSQSCRRRRRQETLLKGRARTRPGSTTQNAPTNPTSSADAMRSMTRSRNDLGERGGSRNSTIPHVAGNPQ